jgi:predicted transcriptional regulator of viral defense system
MIQMKGEGPDGPRDLADWLLARGRHYVTTSEAAGLLGVPVSHVAPLLQRWIRKGLFFSPTKGLYVPIPPQYRAWGALPGAEFIDAMMQHLGHDYFVCLLSAAEIHGFAHQRPQTFQVMTNARLRDRSFGRVHVSFVYSSSLTSRSVIVRNTSTGVIRVSSLECTILDLVSMPLRSGGLSNVATILGEVVEEQRLDSASLCKAASRYPASVVARTGWLFEHAAVNVERTIELDGLRSLVEKRVLPSLLDSGGPQLGDFDERWNVIVNKTIEFDA